MINIHTYLVLLFSFHIFEHLLFNLKKINKEIHTANQVSHSPEKLFVTVKCQGIYAQTFVSQVGLFLPSRQRVENFYHVIRKDHVIKRWHEKLCFCSSFCCCCDKSESDCNCFYHRRKIWVTLKRERSPDTLFQLKKRKAKANSLSGVFLHLCFQGKTSAVIRSKISYNICLA